MTDLITEKNNNQLFQSFCDNNILNSESKNSEKKYNDEDTEFTFKKGFYENISSTRNNIYSKNDQNIIQSGHFGRNKNEPSKFRTIIENDSLNKTNGQNTMKKYLFKFSNDKNLIKNLKKSNNYIRNKITNKISITRDSPKLIGKHFSLIKSKTQIKFLENKNNLIYSTITNKHNIKSQKQEKNKENINNNILSNSKNTNHVKKDKNICLSQVTLELKNMNKQNKNCYRKIKDIKKNTSPDIKEYFGKINSRNNIDYICIHDKQSNFNKTHNSKMSQCNFTMKYENNCFDVQTTYNFNKKIINNSLKKYKSFNNKTGKPFVKNSNYTSKKSENVLPRFNKF